VFDLEVVPDVLVMMYSNPRIQRRARCFLHISPGLMSLVVL
jgi:hypothetical protein